MKINVYDKESNVLKIGCVICTRWSNERYLVVKTMGDDYPVALLDLDDNEIYDEFESLSAIKKEFDGAIFYQPNEVVMEVGKK